MQTRRALLATVTALAALFVAPAIGEARQAARQRSPRNANAGCGRSGCRQRSWRQLSPEKQRDLARDHVR